MELFFSPLACSLATRVALQHAGAPATYTYVDSRTKHTEHGEDFRKLNPLGLVPTLRTDDGLLLTENAAILQYVAERFPDARLAPDGSAERARLRQWLSFVGSELHKGLFSPLLDPSAPEAVRSYALEKGSARLQRLDEHLTGREFLLERFSVADAYLATVLNWTLATPQIELARWPAVHAYLERMRAFPAFASAFALERELYAQQLERRKNG